MTADDVISWGLAGLLWLGLLIASAAVGFCLIVLVVLAWRVIRDAFTR